MFHTNGNSGPGLEMARRRYQRGGLVLKCSRKKWVLQIREDVETPGGVTRHLKTIFVGWLEDLPTKPLARRRADVLLAQAGINDLDYRPRGGATFGELVSMFNDLGMADWKEGSKMKAAEHLRLHLVPHFGHLCLDAIGNLEVQTAIKAWAPRLGEHSIRNVLGTLGSVYGAAKDWGFPTQRWHLDGLRIPRSNKPKRETAFTVPEVRAVLQAAVNPWRAVYALGTLGGLRGEETLGLHRQDVNLETGTMRIRWTVGPHRILQDTKTGKGNRTIPLAPPLVAILRDHLERTWTPNAEGLLFATRTGRPMNHSKILEFHLYPLLESLGISQRGLHAFRHTATSLLIEEGVPLPLVQQIVGHAHVETTLGIYAHVIRPEHRAAMEKLSGVLMPDDAGKEIKSLTVN